MLVTGASWRVAIGAAIARRLVADGAWVMLQSWSPHDQEQSWRGTLVARTRWSPSCAPSAAAKPTSACSLR